ncbi:MAG: flagellar basal-body rod protein FlgB [Planctomycetes bacterium RBG_13_60_9]|nr:MAG: flagellar basal-body rod protein FlgB [Planctomycetes bacterium RBG_13_60_9]
MPEPSTIDLLQAGIRAEELRQKTIASNIANVETPGYRRVDVKFERLLAKALDCPGRIDLDRFEPELYRPNDPALKSNGNNVSMEAEIGDLVRTSLRHTTYVRLLHKKFSQIQAAIR